MSEVIPSGVRLLFASVNKGLPDPYTSVPVLLNGWLGMYSGFVNEDGQWQVGPLRKEDFPPDYRVGMDFSQPPVNPPPDGAQRVDYWVDSHPLKDFQLGWYSIHECLPFYMEPVLIYCDYKGGDFDQQGVFFGMFVPYQDEHHRLWWNVSNQGITHDVMYWMPITVPPAPSRKLKMIGPYQYLSENENK